MTEYDGGNPTTWPDEAAIAEWRERLPVLRQFWEGVAGRVLRDVAASTGLDLTWEVVVHEDEVVWPPLPDSVVTGAAGSVLALVFDDDDGMPRLGRRPLAFPQLWLESSLAHRQL